MTFIIGMHFCLHFRTFFNFFRTAVVYDKEWQTISISISDSCSQVTLSHAEGEGEGSSFCYPGLICSSQWASGLAPKTWHPGPPCLHAGLLQHSDSFNSSLLFCTQLFLTRTEPTILCAEMFQHLLLVSCAQSWLILKENVGEHQRTI